MENKLIESFEKMGEAATPTQKIAVYVNGVVDNEKMDLAIFCEQHGIDISNIIKTSRLFQLDNTDIISVWENSNEEEQNVFRHNISELYRAVVSLQKAKQN